MLQAFGCGGGTEHAAPPLRYFLVERPQRSYAGFPSVKLAPWMVMLTTTVFFFAGLLYEGCVHTPLPPAALSVPDQAKPPVTVAEDTAQLHSGPNLTSLPLDRSPGEVHPGSVIYAQYNSAENPLQTSKDPHEKGLYHDIIIRAADRHGIDPALVKAIIMAESRYNPRAVSKKGAKGLMQLMPMTARSLGLEDVFNPEKNINAGVGYFRNLLDQFNGDLKLALAAYNAGGRRVREHGGIPPFRATRVYIQKVFKYYERYKYDMAAKVKPG